MSVDMDQRFEQWDRRVAETARAFAYPPTPDIAVRLRAGAMATVVAARAREAQTRTIRRVAFAAMAVVLLALAMLAVPPVRAAIVQFLRIGAVQITLVEPTPTPTPIPTPTTLPTPLTPATLSLTPTITPTSLAASATPRPLGSVLDLGGQTTLAQARAEISFPIRLPTYPPDLAQPDAAFVQDLGDETVLLVWVDRAQPRRVRLALHLLGPKAAVEKIAPRIVRETRVNGNNAVWAVGEYVLVSRNGDWDIRRLITGSTLIWTEGRITYRLETDLPMEEAVKIAESLR